MDVIEVPAVPKEAFNKHRRISDLIKAQVAHLKHLEHNLRPGEAAQIPQHAIVTENDAAIYIAAMTRLLCAGVPALQAPSRPKRRVVPIRPAKVYEIAAAATEAEGKPKKQTAKKPAKSKTRSRGQR